jgi:endonuclease III-like uncharacterized protein
VISPERGNTLQKQNLKNYNLKNIHTMQNTTINTTKAESIISYFESEDFRNNYAEYLLQDTSWAQARILNLFNVQDYETEKYLSNHKRITQDQAEQIYLFIVDNVEEFTTTFNGYYVGHTSIDSIAYGEHEESIEPGERENFEENDFCVNDEGTTAYYDMSSQGVHIDLLRSIDILNEFLLTI